MNDFTKEELEIIHLDMTTYINIAPMLNESPSHKALRDKVVSMIESYCKHDGVNIMGIPGMQCKNCKRMIE